MCKASNRLSKRHRRALRAYNKGTKALDVDPHVSQREFLKSLGQSPFNENAWINLGNAMMNEGDVESALGMYRRAMWCNATDARGAVNAAIALLTLGRYEEGWKLYEARFALPEFTLRNGLKGGDASKMWRGESLEGKALLVFNEQGVGDSLMMLRYGYDLMFKGVRRVVYRVPTSLLRLVRAAHRGGDLVEVVTDSAASPEHDYLVPFMSLPHWCGEDRFLFPMNAKGFLSLYPEDTERADHLRRYAGVNSHRTRVGIVWKGSPHHKGDKRRSMTREQFDAFAIPGVDLVTLQYGEYGFSPIDFYDTAVMLKSLDLLISVDTSTAHLAGGLGVPTWLLLPFNADFRWGLHSETTPWYANHRLFRQTKRGEWGDVIQTVARELASLVEQRRAA